MNKKLLKMTESGEIFDPERNTKVTPLRLMGLIMERQEFQVINESTWTDVTSNVMHDLMITDLSKKDPSYDNFLDRFLGLFFKPKYKEVSKVAPQVKPSIQAKVTKEKEVKVPSDIIETMNKFNESIKKFNEAYKVSNSEANKAPLLEFPTPVMTSEGLDQKDGKLVDFNSAFKIKQEKIAKQKALIETYRNPTAQDPPKEGI